MLFNAFHLSSNFEKFCVSYQLYVRLTDEEAASEYLWTKRQFLNRQSYVQEMYQRFEETGAVPQIEQVIYFYDMSIS
jgi:hypothetical protein